MNVVRAILVLSVLSTVACSKKSSSSSQSSTTTPTPAIPCVGKVMFLAAVSNGNLGGASGADAICNANKPTGFSSSTFKALLGAVSGRAACYVSGNDSCTGSVTGRVDWPLAANQNYCSSDYVNTVGATDSMGYIDVLAPNSLSTTGTVALTGFNTAWGISTSDNCTSFTSSASATVTGGISNSTGQGFYAGTAAEDCTTANHIYCVEQ